MERKTKKWVFLTLLMLIHGNTLENFTPRYTVRFLDYTTQLIRDVYIQMLVILLVQWLHDESLKSEYLICFYYQISRVKVKSSKWNIFILSYFASRTNVFSTKSSRPIYSKSKSLSTSQFAKFSRLWRTFSPQSPEYSDSSTYMISQFCYIICLLMSIALRPRRLPIFSWSMSRGLTCTSNDRIVQLFVRGVRRMPTGL